MYNFDLYLWRVPMMFTYEVYLRCLPMKSTYDVYLWRVHMMYTWNIAMGIGQWLYDIWTLLPSKDQSFSGDDLRNIFG